MERLRNFTSLIKLMILFIRWTCTSVKIANLQQILRCGVKIIAMNHLLWGTIRMGVKLTRWMGATTMLDTWARDITCGSCSSGIATRYYLLNWYTPRYYIPYDHERADVEIHVLHCRRNNRNRDNRKPEPQNRFVGLWDCEPKSSWQRRDTLRSLKLYTNSRNFSTRLRLVVKPSLLSALAHRFCYDCQAKDEVSCISCGKFCVVISL